MNSDPFLDELFQVDAAKQRKASESEERRRARLTLAVREVLKTDNGKRFLFWLINQTGVFAPCFTGNSSTFYLEGKRSVGLDVYRLLLEADPNAFQELINFRRAGEASGTAWSE